MRTLGASLLVAWASVVSAQATPSFGFRRCDLDAGVVRCEEERFDGERTATVWREVELHDPAVALSATGDRACVLDAAGDVSCWSLDEDAVDYLLAHEVVALRGRVAALGVGWHFVCALLVDGTATCWGSGRGGRLGRGGEDDAREPDALGPAALVRSEAGPLEDLTRIFVDDAHACALDRGGSFHCWGEGAVHATVQPLRIAPIALRCSTDGCCAYDDARTLECWGDVEARLAPLVRDLPDWRDLVLDSWGACVASEHRVECDGSLRPETDEAIWSGFHVRRDRIVGLVPGPMSVCVVTTGDPRCWGYDYGAPEEVDPTVASSHWRLAPGERVLRVVTEPVACREDAGSEEDTTLAANGSRRGVRVAIRGLVYNCARDPRVEARLRTDGTIELGLAAELSSGPWARCECSFDLDAVVRGVPTGAHDVVFEPEGRRPALAAHVVVE